MSMDADSVEKARKYIAECQCEICRLGKVPLWDWYYDHSADELYSGRSGVTLLVTDAHIFAKHVHDPRPSQ